MAATISSSEIPNIIASGLTINQGIASTSTSTGSLVVTGGAGFSGTINAVSESLNGGVASTSTSTGTLIVTGGIGVSGNTSTSSAKVTGGTASTSTSTGSLVVTGGIGSSGNIYNAGNVVIGDSTTTGAGPLMVNISATGSYTGAVASAATLIGRSNPLSSGLVGAQSATVFVVNDDPYDGTTSGREASIGFRTRSYYDGNSPTTYAKIGGSSRYSLASYYGQMNFEVLSNNSANLVQVMTLTDNGLRIDPTGSYANYPTKPLDVTGNAGVSGWLTAGSLTVSGGVAITSTTASTSTSAGALVVSGSAGFAKTIFAPSAVFNAGTASTSTNTGSLVVSGGAGFSNTIFAPSAVLNGGIASTSTSSGSLLITGGLGVSGTINSGPIVMNGGTGDASLVIKGGTTNAVGVWMGELDYSNWGARVYYNSNDSLQFGVVNNGTTYSPMTMSSSVVSIPYTTPSTATNSGALVVTGGVGVGGNINAPAMGLVGGAASTSTSSGALVVVGGIGVSGTTTSSSLKVAGNTASTSTSTGAAIIGGGLGVAGDIYASNIFANPFTVATLSPTMHITSVSGATVTATSGSFTFLLVKCGNLRILNIPQLTFTQTNNSAIYSDAGIIPADSRQSTLREDRMFFPVNSSGSFTTGVIDIITNNSDGTGYFIMNPINTTFKTGSTEALYRSYVTWYLWT